MDNELNNQLNRSDDSKPNPVRDFAAMGRKGGMARSESSLARSARNATKHGLAGKSFMLLHSEDSEVFAKHKAEYYKALRPTDIVECNYVDRMVEQSWLMQRLNAMEAEAMNLQIEEQRKLKNTSVLESYLEANEASESGDSETELPMPPTYSEVGLAYIASEHLTKTNCSFANLPRYRVAIERSFERAHKALLAFRAGKESTPGAPCMLPSPDTTGLFRPSPSLQQTFQEIRSRRGRTKPTPQQNSEAA